MIEFDEDRDYCKDRAEWIKNAKEIKFETHQQMSEKYKNWERANGEYSIIFDLFYNKTEQKMAMVFWGLPGVGMLSGIEVDNVKDETDIFYKKTSIISLLLNSLNAMTPKITVSDLINIYIESASNWAQEYDVRRISQESEKVE